MTTILNGQSEIDTVNIRYSDNGVEILDWESFDYNQNFLKPTCEWSFNIADPNGNFVDTLVGGVGIDIFINDKIQCAGIIEKITTSINPGGGTILHVQGRDIMAKVVENAINPKLQFPNNTTLESIIKAVLAPLGITQIDDSDHTNLNVLTGKRYPPDEDQGFNKKALKELKANYGEGCYQFLDKLMKRQGFMMWARADGKGVVVSQPNWKNNSELIVKHTQNIKNSTNNVLYGDKIVDITGQPTMIYCKGFTTGAAAPVVSSDVIMINELIGLDYEGNPLPEVIDIIAQYQDQGVKILNLRDVLIPLRQSLYQKPINTGAIFIKDKEAQDQGQLENFLKRTMAHIQVKMFNLHYRVVGHTQNGIPWAVNTLVNVIDDVLDIHEPYWVIEKTFHKSIDAGTYTDLKLIKPYTLDISTNGGKGTTSKVPYKKK
jgi:prophage tail gpP-like protein